VGVWDVGVLGVFAGPVAWGGGRLDKIPPKMVEKSNKKNRK